MTLERNLAGDTVIVRVQATAHISVSPDKMHETVQQLITLLAHHHIPPELEIDNVLDYTISSPLGLFKG